MSETSSITGSSYNKRTASLDLSSILLTNWQANDKRIVLLDSMKLIITVLFYSFKVKNEVQLYSLKLVDLVVDQTYSDSITLRKLNDKYSTTSKYQYFNTVSRKKNIVKCPIFGIGLYFLISWGGKNILDSKNITFVNFSNKQLIDFEKISSDTVFNNIIASFIELIQDNVNGSYKNTPILANNNDLRAKSLRNDSASNGFMDDFDSRILRAEIEPPEELAKMIFPWLDDLQDEFHTKDRTNYNLHSLIELFKYLSKTIIQDLLYISCNTQLAPNLQNILFNVIPDFYSSKHFKELKLEMQKIIEGVNHQTSYFNLLINKLEDNMIDVSSRVNNSNLQLRSEINEMKLDINGLRDTIQELLVLQRQIWQKINVNSAITANGQQHHQQQRQNQTTSNTTNQNITTTTTTNNNNNNNNNKNLNNTNNNIQSHSMLHSVSGTTPLLLPDSNRNFNPLSPIDPTQSNTCLTPSLAPATMFPTLSTVVATTANTPHVSNTPMNTLVSMNVPSGSNLNNNDNNNINRNNTLNTNSNVRTTAIQNTNKANNNNNNTALTNTFTSQPILSSDRKRKFQYLSVSNPQATSPNFSDFVTTSPAPSLMNTTGNTISNNLNTVRGLQQYQKSLENTNNPILTKKLKAYSENNASSIASNTSATATVINSADEKQRQQAKLQPESQSQQQQVFDNILNRSVFPTSPGQFSLPAITPVSNQLRGGSPYAQNIGLRTKLNSYSSPTNKLNVVGVDVNNVTSTVMSGNEDSSVTSNKNMLNNIGNNKINSSLGTIYGTKIINGKLLTDSENTTFNNNVNNLEENVIEEEEEGEDDEDGDDEDMDDEDMVGNSEENKNNNNRKITTSITADGEQTTTTTVMNTDDKSIVRQKRKYTRKPKEEGALGPNYAIKYKLSRANKTIYDLYTEWYFGLNGKLSIKQLIAKYGWRRWKVTEDSHFFPTRRIIIDYIEKEVSLGFSNGKFDISAMTRDHARSIVVNDLEKFRTGNGLTLNSLSMMFRNLKRQGMEINIYEDSKRVDANEKVLDDNIIVGDNGWIIKRLSEENKNRLCKRRNLTGNNNNNNSTKMNSNDNDTI
ncbi:uncharacterized protein SCODWIG_00836 [Saccharomycodes ludwigii]|uniref:Transcription activator GCR1-like domain-containing protein n=1 Tax=Saccharomycodes ludwigii TaxID=36035 RepID=A0A376B316_9ASCO|nr:uncharacterized protein SCODWIG_00836 [Saccharomycodes ludwigii]